MLETIALWYCYVAGATLAIALYAILALWAIDKLAQCLRLKKEFLEWYFAKMKAKSGRFPG